MAKTTIRENFKFYKWWYTDYILQLKCDKIGKVLHALLEYAFFGIETEITDNMSRFVYNRIKKEIDKQPKN